MVDRFRVFGDRFGVWPIIALAALTRLWALGYPNKLVFDETYYVKDAFTLWQAGHELSWKPGNEETFSLTGFVNSPEFVVHSPLGKWIIGFGMQIFGVENPFGWRIMVALFGIASVWFLYLISLRLLGSKRWALVPAFFLAIDGQAIVISRTAILDGLVATFVLVGFYCLLRALSETDNLRWILGMGVVLGAGAAVKWSAAIFLIVFLAYYLFDTRRWKSLFALPFAGFVYLVCWTGWFISHGWGYNRNDVLGSFIADHLQIYHFHAGLSVYHPYQTSPLTWLAMIRPTSFFFENQGTLVSAISPIGNPVIWLGGIFGLAFLFAWFARNRDRLSLLIFTGYFAGYLPWLLYSGRTSFQFYSVSFEPWIILAAVLMAYRYSRARLVLVGSSVAFGIFLFFLPLYFGWQIPLWFWQLHMWLPTWV